jgi:hypothetical protein
MIATAENDTANHRCQAVDFLFCQKLTNAVPALSRRLQAHYEHLHPDQTDVIREIVAEAEATAWELSLFPHLLLPDLVEARIAELALQPALAGAA